MKFMDEDPRNIANMPPLPRGAVIKAEEEGDMVFQYRGLYPNDYEVYYNVTVEELLAKYDRVYVGQYWGWYKERQAGGTYVVLSSGAYIIDATVENDAHLRYQFDLASETQKDQKDSSMFMQTSFRTTEHTVSPGTSGTVQRWKLPGGSTTLYAKVTSEQMKAVDKKIQDEGAIIAVWQNYSKITALDVGRM